MKPTPINRCTYLTTGKEDLRFKKEESRTGEVQICLGLQDQRAEETDRAS